ncbi:Dihydrolipoamide acetyltransferase component of pyruvate dehydrogenase complex [hydrothermal vent metagenome]|uniref:Dihydrolipoamide acetyltransferase component of pyruvate dehydrogenase complex n=1 Tax=hydrothermal vent metagenome TaxID=652676 RepID=A0A3B0RHX8_9ZZZZ
MDIIMPQLGETVEEGTILVWLKKAGDTVSKDDPLFEVETDKVTTEIPASMDGVLTEILVGEDETVPVGTKVAVLTGEGEEVSVSEEEPLKEDVIAEPVQTEVDRKTVPRMEKGAEKLSPAVRRLLAEHNLDINQIKGGGGRITRKDIENYLEDHAGESGVKVVPFNRLRLKTAERMVEAKTTAPHVFQGVEVIFGEIEKLRQVHKSDWKERHGFSLTYLPFIARATCMALKEYGNLNAHLKENRMLIHDRINLGIAVDLGPEGLIVPVIKDAGTKTVTELACEMKDLAERARGKTLKPDELAGATYTISNSGSFGTFFTAPIINLPQVAIMSTDGVVKKPVVVEDAQGDSIVIQPVGVIAQSFDHRAIDGAYSASFLKQVKTLLEQHDWSGEL